MPARIECLAGKTNLAKAMEMVDDELLAKFLAGQADRDGQARVEAWAGADPRNAAELEQLAILWQRPPAGTWDLDSAWRRTTELLDRPVIARPSEKAGLGTRRGWFAFAAAALVVVAVGAALFSARGRGELYETAVGAQREIALDDGSRVVLAPTSRLEVRKGYGKEARSVSLVGRAWFQVRHDEQRPFRVITKTAIIEDRGTEFEVLAPDDGATVRVAVMEGSVSVQPLGTPSAAVVDLDAGDLVNVARTGPPEVQREARVSELTGWQQGILKFYDAPLPEIIRELGRWYGVKFRLADSTLSTRTFSGDLITSNLEEVLSILRSGLGGVEIERSDSTVTIRPKG